MEIRFARYPSDASPEPAEGELWLIPADAARRQRRDLACLALESGPGGFVQGRGTPAAIVVQLDPTLDDMLAASILERQLEDQTPPNELTAYARYVAAVREGLRPGTVPLEVSLEGVYLACRNLSGADLSQTEHAARFLARWRTLAGSLFRAAEQEVDPFNTPLLADDPDFVRERAFLQEDQKVYRQDVRNGERWLVRLPQGPPLASGLLLHQPKSVLWKYWARSDEQAPEGNGYLFTAVHWGEGAWIFSTDPVHRVPIGGLADVLQAAERLHDADAAAANPWFDGKPFDHTLVAAPRGGTQLSPREVERLVRRWAAVKRAPRVTQSGRPVGGVVSTVVSCCVLALLGVILFRLSESEAPATPLPPAPRETRDDGTFSDRNRPSRLFVLGIGPTYADEELTLKYTDDDVEHLVTAFAEHSGGFFDEVVQRIIVGEEATREGILEGMLWLERGGLPLQEADQNPDARPRRNDLVIVTISGHGAVEHGAYFLLTHHSRRDEDPRMHGVRWDDLADTLNACNCTSIILLDTCHSGAATAVEAGRDRGASRTRDADAYQAAIEDARYMFQENEKGVIVLPACLGDQTAKEHEDWQHGALSLAVLEAVTGRLVVPALSERTTLPPYQEGTYVISFADLEYYVSHRVWDLTEQFSPEPQLVEAKSSNSEVLDRWIPIARRRDR